MRVEVKPFRILVTVVALSAAALAAYPLIRVFGSIFFADGRFDIGALAEVRHVSGLKSLLLNTFSIVIVSGAISLLLGAVLAWLNERSDASLGPLGRALPIIPFLIPPIASGVGWLLLFDPTVGIGNTILRELLSYVGLNLDHGPINIASWWGLTFVLAIVHVP